MNHIPGADPVPDKIKIRFAPPAGAADDTPRNCHCQICGAVVGTGITHCLGCYGTLKVNASKTNAAPTNKTNPWGPIILLLLGAAVAFWYWQRTSSRSQLAEPHATLADDTVPVTAVTGAEAPPPARLTASAMPATPANAPGRSSQVASPPTQPHVSRPAPVTTPRPDTRSVKLTSTCRACGGSGRISQHGSMRTCPVCRGTPKKHRWVSPTFTLCPTCAGFGSVLEMHKGTRLKRTCRTCQGRGIIKKEAQ